MLSVILISSLSWAQLVYVPERLDVSSAKVIVVIHGCLQSAEIMALGTGWNQKADQHNLVIVYPQVPSESHQLDCWSWYLPENQRAESGQLFFVKDQVIKWKKRLKLEKAPVYVTGISSGAATAAGLMSCFPESFTAGALVAGPSYGRAENLKEGEGLLKSGLSSEPRRRACQPNKFKKPILVIQGEADAVVHPKNAQIVVSDFLSHASPIKPTSGQINGFKYRATDYQSHGHAAGRLVLIEGLGHSWSGNHPNFRKPEVFGPQGKLPIQLPFFSSEGPNTTELIWDYFKMINQ